MSDEGAPPSACCNAPLRVYAADEGTCCFVCSGCGKPSDPRKPEKDRLWRRIIGGLLWIIYWRRSGGEIVTGLAILAGMAVLAVGAAFFTLGDRGPRYDDSFARGQTNSVEHTTGE